MFATNASGAHSSKYGNVNEYVIDAEVVLSDGRLVQLSDISGNNFDNLSDTCKALYTLYEENVELINENYPAISCNVCGYNLRGLVSDRRLNLINLFAGSEGTLGIVTKLKFRLLEKPTFDSLVIAYFDDILKTAKAVNMVLPLHPAGIEIMDKSLLDLACDFDENLRSVIRDGSDNVLLIEFDSFDKMEVIENTDKVTHLLRSNNMTESVYKATDLEEKNKFWAIRKAAVPVLYKLKGDKKIIALVEDAAIAPDKLDEYFKGIYNIFGKYNVDFVVYGHIAKGLLHTRPLLNLKLYEDVKLLKILADEVFYLVRSLGGTISGEHGDGRIRSYYIKEQYQAIYPLFKEVKRILDKDHLLNPEVKTSDDPYLLEKNLRYGYTYKSKDLEDKKLIWNGNFVNEVELCHGCSKCTTTVETVRMCPVYKFTMDGKAAPKAKANILRALISGVISDKSIFEKYFQEVINCCIGCGSCYLECPSNVNIPKMAIEAKSIYIDKFGVPLKYKFVVNVDKIARYARKIMPPVNILMKSYKVRKLISTITGVAAENGNVPIAYKSLHDIIKKVENPGKNKVMFFAGCYYSYFEPSVGVKTVKLLASLGFEVLTPKQYCCGIPMAAKGMYKHARNTIRKNLDEWCYLVDTVSYIVVSCSSCGLALMKDWKDIITGDEIDKISSKTIHITSLLSKYKEKINVNKQLVEAAYHMPCHLKVQRNSDASIKLLQDLDFINLKVLESNCCGLAGSWGVLQDNYKLSAKIGEDLSVKINESGCRDILTDCPACRMRIKQISQKRVLHPVEIIYDSLIKSLK
jgi:Fe-S oxidoreductase/FAD/FMN-containing dehydrogenase